jgi:hypothetical protein
VGRDKPKEDKVYDLALTIPANIRAGKFLRRFAPDDFGQDFSSLVESLEFCPTLAKSEEEWKKALISCNSCQSRDQKTRNTYYKVWSQVDGVDLLVLRDKSGQTVARCLINRSRHAFAPIYGQKHYLLESRLRYAGYSQGEIAPAEAVRRIVAEVETEDYVKPLPFRPVEIDHRVVVANNPDAEIQSILSRWDTWQKNNAAARVSRKQRRAWNKKIFSDSLQMLNWYGCGYQAYLAVKGAYIPPMSAETKRRKGDLQRAKHLWAKWEKECRLAGVSTDSEKVVRNLTIRRAAKGYEWVDEYRDTVKSSLYLDSERCFIEVTIDNPAGWVKVA